MADKKLNELGTTVNFDNAYVELSQNQYRISKTNLGKQLTKEVHLNFSVASDTPAYIFAQKSDGTNFRISKSDLAKAIKSDLGISGGGGSQSVDTDTLYDGCFIMFRDVDGLEAATYSQWPSLQNSGEVANGVLIVEGGHALLVAPHEKSCYWSSKNGTATTTVSNRRKLFDTWDGEERTEKICTDPSSPFYFESENSTYAPGYCYNYRINDSGILYWLPCVAELMMIYAHKHKINAGLALIRGAQQLSDNFYWSSTEYNANNAWSMDFDLGGIWYHLGKTMQEFCARPVSTMK